MFLLSLYEDGAIFRSYNSTYATSPAAAAVYNATVQSQPTPHTPTLGAAVGATNPTSVYAR